MTAMTVERCDDVAVHDRIRVCKVHNTTGRITHDPEFSSDSFGQTENKFSLVVSGVYRFYTVCIPFQCHGSQEDFIQLCCLIFVYISNCPSVPPWIPQLTRRIKYCKVKNIALRDTTSGKLSNFVYFENSVRCVYTTVCRKNGKYDNFPVGRTTSGNILTFIFSTIIHKGAEKKCFK